MIQKNEVFKKTYAQLNKAQKEAVDAIEGPVMVIAGPGTGKTQILTLRIANILEKTDTAPENILALTFTEAGAGNMRKRLAQLIGNPAYRVEINTFHGFCNMIIKKYPEDFPRIIGSTSITEVDQVKIIENIIETSEKHLTLLKPFGDRLLYVRDIIAAISDLKREGISPDGFYNIVAEEKKSFESIPDLHHEKGAHKGKMKGDYQKLERKILKNQELAWIYEQYQEYLKENKQYDFNDMIMEVLQALQTNPSLLQILQEEHQYVLVDEHQDTNNAQNKILELLMSHFVESPNLFVVGDEKQAIFRFQGASLENFLYFKKLYPNAQLIVLNQNYRSTQSILDHAENVLPGKERLRSSSLNDSGEGLGVRTAEFDNYDSEIYFIANDIKEKKGEDIAVLYRNNRDAFSMARALEKVGVEYVIESDQDLFSQSDVQKILIMLRAIADYGNNEHLASLLHISLFEIEPIIAYQLIRKAHDEKIMLYTLLPESLAQKLNHWVKLSHEESVVTLFEKVLRESGLLNDILAKSGMEERLEAVNNLFDEIKSMQESNPNAKIKDFFVYLDMVKKHKLFLKRKNIKTSAGKVRLMTVHKSKGLEFDHVYIIHANDGVFGGKFERDKLPLVDGVYKLEK